jgi:hypothetical protein
MIGVTVTFDYSGDFARERVIKVAAGARGMFEGMPGLRLKVFTLDQERQRAANFYVWDSEEAAKGFSHSGVAGQSDQSLRCCAQHRVRGDRRDRRQRAFLGRFRQAHTLARHHDLRGRRSDYRIRHALCHP